MSCDCPDKENEEKHDMRIIQSWEVPLSTSGAHRQALSRHMQNIAFHL